MAPGAEGYTAPVTGTGGPKPGLLPCGFLPTELGLPLVHVHPIRTPTYACAGICFIYVYIYIYKFLFIYLWLYWVFTAGFSLVVARGGYYLVVIVLITVASLVAEHRL